MRGKKAFRDPRFIVGVLLIVVGVGAGAWIIDRDHSGEEYYAAARDIAPGQAVSEADLQVVRATVPAHSYLKKGELSASVYAEHQLTKGELIATGAVSAQSPQQQVMVVSLAQPLPDTSRVGDVVALYRPANPHDATQQSQLLTNSAVIFSLPKHNQIDASTKVEVAIPISDVATVVAALGERNSLIGVLTHEAAASGNTEE